MNVVDAIALVVIVGIAFTGFRRGFARELIETVGVLIAAVGSYVLYPTVITLTSSGTDSNWGTKALVLFGTFVVIMLVITLVGHLFKKILKMISLGQFDHLLGFVLGGLKGGLLVAVVATAAIWILPGGDKYINDSKIVRADLLALNLVSNALPESVQEKYQTIVERGMVASKDPRHFSAAFAIPLQYIDSLRVSPVASGSTTINSMLQSLGSGSRAEERILGIILSWNPDNNRGLVQYSFMDSVRTLPVFPGSFDDSASVINRVGQNISFIPAYSELLRCPYAASVRMEQKKE